MNIPDFRLELQKQSPPRRRKANFSNDGRAFQTEIEKIAAAYRNLGVMRLEKVDAPTRFFGGKVILTENPWPDYVGIWCRNRRMMALEAKSTSDHLLPINVKGGGLTVRQGDSLKDWHKHGAIAGILWEFGRAVKFVAMTDLMAALDRGDRSLKWESCGHPVPPGKGFVTHDFAVVFRALGY